MNRSTWKAAALAAASFGSVLAIRRIARERRYLPLAGRVVLVTGGSRGLGLVLARQLASHGARLALCARDDAELKRARDELSGQGADVLAIACDVTRREDVDALVDLVIDRFGRIDVLVNNAGVIQVGPFEVTTLDDYEQALRTHFWGPLYTTQAVLPGMRNRGAGRIVNVSSIGGKISVPHLLPYGVSKFALTGFSEGLRAELAGTGIYVTTVIPGLMRTGSPRNALFKGKHRAEYAWFSISDSVPVLSTSATAAARRIIRACQYGDAELLLTLPAQVAVRFHGLFPEFTADLLGLASWMLPDAGGIGRNTARGRESQSAVSPSWATALTEKAAALNNELPDAAHHEHSPA